MNTDIDFDLTDFDLTLAQWETLKALRMPASGSRIPDGLALQELIGFDLAVITENGPMITTRGRKVVLRGSPRLWDVAA